MSGNPKISIIVPAYNAEKTIVMCVDSLINQTYENLEIILVNDCSTDNTAAMCEELSRKHANVRTVHLPVNSGLAQARNAGMEVADGEWFAFVDSDDWLEPEAYLTVVEYAQKHNAQCVIWSYVSEYGPIHKEKHIYGTDVVFTGDTANNIFIDTLGPTGERLAHPEHIHSLSVAWNKLFRADVIRANRLVYYDLEKIGAEDLHFSAQYLNCIKDMTSVYIDKCLYHYIKANEASLSTKHKPIYTQMAITINSELEKMIKNRDDSAQCMKALKNRRALSLINIGLNEVAASDGAFKITGRLRKVICDKAFHEAFSQLEYKYLPLKWKVFFLCAKHRMAFCVYILLKIMTVLMARND